MSRRMRRAVALLAAAAATITATVAAAPPSLAGDAQTYYVFGDGNDSASCLTQHSACQTIQAALAKATTPGDTVVVGTGSYSGTVTVSSPVTIVNFAGDTPTLSDGLAIDDAGGDVRVQGLTFDGTGGITVDANTGATTIADDVFDAVSATAIQLAGPGSDPAMAVTLDGNSGTVAAPARTVTVTGDVAVTAGAPDTITWTATPPAITAAGPPVHVAPDGGGQDLASLTVPDRTPALSNARYDVGVTSASVIDGSQVHIDDDSGNDAHLTGDTGPGDALTGSLPFVAGPDPRTVSVATTGGAPSTLTVTISLVEYDQHDVALNQIALASTTVVDNHPPDVTDATATVAASGPTPITLGPVTDSDGQLLTYTVTSAPAHGTLGAVTGNRISYTPDADSGTSDRFTFTASDGLDTSGPVTASVTINTAPAAAATTVELLDTATSTPVVLSGSDPDPGQNLTYAIASPPAHGTIALDPATGRATYTVTGATPQNDSFTYTVTDGLDTSSAASVTIQVVHGPVADPKTVSIGYTDSSATLTLSGSDSTPDATLTFHVPTTTAGGGTLGFDPLTDQVTYVPPSGTPTDDSFTYTVDDGTFTSAPATVTIAVHHAPVASDRAAVLDEGAPSVRIPLQGTADPGRELTFAVPTTAAHGSVSFDPATEVATYTPSSGALTGDSFSYTVNDGTYTSTPATVTITPNHRPGAAAASMTMTDTDPSVSVPLPATDADQDPLTLTLATIPRYGTVTIDQTNGTATYTPAGTPQDDSFSYTASDGRLTSAPATVTITVNHHPTAAGATRSWRCNSGSHSLTLPGVDPDGTEITFRKAASPAHGRVTITAAGVATYTPGTDFVGADSFSYTVVDATGLVSAKATVQIAIVRALSSITTSLSPARPTSAQHPVLTVHVSSRGRLADGLVAVATGSGTRTARVAKNGTAALSLPSYPGGVHTISAVFRGTSTASASAARTVRFTVTRVASSLSVTTNPLQLTTTTTNATATVRVGATSLAANSGTVTIAENGRRLAAGAVRHGSLTLHLPRFSLGQHNLSVSYSGTSTIAPSSVLKVERVSLGP